jgi:hypothetical protein
MTPSDNREEISIGLRERLNATVDKAKAAFSSGKESVAEKSEKLREESQKGIETAREKMEEVVRTGKESPEDLKRKHES